MKEKIKYWLGHNQSKLLIIVAVAFVVVGAFYWFELRPIEIRKECIRRYPSAMTRSDQGAAFKKCLLEQGLDY